MSPFPCLIVADSVTRLDDAAGAVLVAGSHGGLYAAYLAAKARVRAVILNDAGRGLDDAGIAGVDWLDRFGIPAATVSHTSARIGDGADMIARGVLSHANRAARPLGIAPGQPCAVAAEMLLLAPDNTADPPPVIEAKHRLRDGPREVWALDSISLIGPEHARAIVVTASHGGLLGGRPETAAKHPALALLYNDAGFGIDRAGVTRLPALDDRGIGAATYAAFSARIGDARSAWETGRLTVVNGIARGWGVRPGMTVQEFADRAASALQEKD